MEILLNGQRSEAPEDCTLAQLLQRLETPADRVAVELNGRIVRRTAWETTPVPPGSRLEIVQFVGGG